MSDILANSGYIPGRNIEYPVRVSSIDAYKKEAIENYLNNLALMDRHYLNFNTKFLSAISQRKERVNNIVRRIAYIQSKFKTLESVKKAIRISAPRAYPLQKSRKHAKSIHFDDGFNPSEEDVDPIYNKIYGQRIIHEVGELGSRVETSAQDLSNLIQCYNHINLERDTLGEMYRSKRQENESILGRTPSVVKNISELLLFNSSTNVYSDVHAGLPNSKWEKACEKNRRKQRKSQKMKDNASIFYPNKVEENSLLQAPPLSIIKRKENNGFKKQGFLFEPELKEEEKKLQVEKNLNFGTDLYDFVDEKDIIGGEKYNYKEDNFVGIEDAIAPMKVRKREKKTNLNKSQMNYCTNAKPDYSRRKFSEGDDSYNDAPIDFMLKKTIF
ncbi:unnamed protein product [Moneuplotes crassus]|uniref:WASH1 WAHD domain-containing protein n=1 Tax=Euplotes crassus TaxID=5936 RepID=A0AAD1U8L6_EUPCR|nr:unnamed protein product [Moneuplotes crassus]